MNVTIAGKPGEGHGITNGLLARLYEQLQRGQTPGQIVALVVMDPIGATLTKTAKGTHQGVKLELTRVEVVPADEASRIRMQIENLYESRTSRGGAVVLPLGFADDLEREEKRLELRETVDTWADANGWTGAQLEEKWRSHFGVGQGSDVQADWTTGSAQHLLQFAQTLGAVKETSATGPLDGDDGEPAPEPDPQQEAADIAAAARRGEVPDDAVEDAVEPERDATPAFTG